jgi:hypothetical protein
MHGASSEVRPPQADKECIEGYRLASRQGTGLETLGSVEEVLGRIGEEGDEEADGRDGESLDQQNLIKAGHGKPLVRSNSSLDGRLRVKR